MTLTEFLLARIAEDEATVADLLWSRTRPRAQNGSPHWIVSTPGRCILDGGSSPSPAHGARPVLDHIARWDPARVLAECAAKRGILALHESNPYYGLDRHGRWLPHEGEPKAWFCDCQAEDGMIIESEPCHTKRLLALPYADHPDFDPAWSVTP